MAYDPTDTNRHNALLYLYRHPHGTRTAFAKRAGITAGTVSGVIKTLIEEGAVVQTGAALPATNGTGRKQQVLAINATFGQTIGVEFMRTGVHGVLCDLHGQILDRCEIPWTAAVPAHIN